MATTNFKGIVAIEVNGDTSKWPNVVVTSFIVKKIDSIETGQHCFVHGVSAAQNTSNILAWLNGEDYLIVNTPNTRLVRNDSLIIGPPSVLGKNVGLTAFVTGIVHNEYSSIA